jgi:hypothetical protein
VKAVLSKWRGCTSMYCPRNTKITFMSISQKFENKPPKKLKVHFTSNTTLSLSLSLSLGNPRQIWFGLFDVLLYPNSAFLHSRFIFRSTNHKPSGILFFFFSFFFPLIFIFVMVHGLSDLYVLEFAIVG